MATINVRLAINASTCTDTLNAQALSELGFSLEHTTTTVAIDVADVAKLLAAIPVGEYRAYEDLIVIYPASKQATGD